MTNGQVMEKKNMTQPRNFNVSRLCFSPAQKHQHSCSFWTALGLYFFHTFSSMILIHHLKLESSNLEFKRPSYGQNKTWVLEKKNFDNNSLQNLYITFYTSWSLRPHKPKKKKNNPKQYNSNSRTNYPKIEELGSP